VIKGILAKSVTHKTETANSLRGGLVQTKAHRKNTPKITTTSPNRATRNRKMAWGGLGEDGGKRKSKEELHISKSPISQQRENAFSLLTIRSVKGPVPGGNVWAGTGGNRGQYRSWQLKRGLRDHSKVLWRNTPSKVPPQL